MLIIIIISSSIIPFSMSCLSKTKYFERKLNMFEKVTI